MAIFPDAAAQNLGHVRRSLLFDCVTSIYKIVTSSASRADFPGIGSSVGCARRWRRHHSPCICPSLGCARRWKRPCSPCICSFVGCARRWRRPRSLSLHLLLTRLCYHLVVLATPPVLVVSLWTKVVLANPTPWCTQTEVCALNPKL